MRMCIVVLSGILCGSTIAQQSSSYRLEEQVFNVGGHPASGTGLSSASWRIELDSIGDTVMARAISSGSYQIDGGFTGSYPPPGEVVGLRFADRTTLQWDSEHSVGAYNLYRGTLDSLSALTYGTCREASIGSESVVEATLPAANSGFFYLVTARNLIDQEGTKGYQSSGAERPNAAPCP